LLANRFFLLNAVFVMIILVLISHVYLVPGTAVTQLLKCCAKHRKVAGSIPAGVSGFFIDKNSSDRTMALGST